MPRRHSAIVLSLLATVLLYPTAPVAALKDRIATTPIELPRALAAESLNYGTWDLSYFSPRLYHAPLPDGGTVVGWTDLNGDGNLSVIDDGAVAATLVFAGTPVCGLIAHDDGTWAVLLADDAAGVMKLRKLDRTGAEIWTTDLVSPYAEPTPDLGDSRLAYGGGIYGCLFAVYGVDGWPAGHYGEQLTFVDDDGAIAAGGWPWGPAHGMAQLIAYNENLGLFAPLSVSDCYPDKGIVWDAASMLHLADGDCAGMVAVQFGQAANRSAGWLLAFNGMQTGLYSGQGVGLLSFDDDPASKTLVWLTATDGSDERDPVLARLGAALDSDRYLSGWRSEATGDFFMCVIDSTGVILEPKEEVSSINVGWGDRDDPLRTRPDGDVSWVEGLAGTTKMALHVFAAQDPTGAPDAPAARLPVLEVNAPNPFNPTTVLTIRMPDDGRARLSVHDLRGRLVRVLHDGPLPQGAHAIAWDGRDDAGRSMPAGAYVAGLETARGATTRKMTLAK